MQRCGCGQRKGRSSGFYFLRALNGVTRLTEIPGEAETGRNSCIQLRQTDANSDPETAPGLPLPPAGQTGSPQIPT